MAEASTRPTHTDESEIAEPLNDELLTLEEVAAILGSSHNLAYVTELIISGELVTFADDFGNPRIYRSIVQAYAQYRAVVRRAALREMIQISEETGGYDRDYSYLLEDDEE